MGSIFDITALLKANTTQFTSGMKNASKRVSGFSKEMNLLKSQMLAVFSVSAITGFAKASIQAYDDQIKAETKLLTAMKGRTDAVERMVALAESLQKTTLFSDDKSLDAMARMAATLGDNEEAIKRLLPLVQDFATVKGMDLSSAADLISKTFASSTNSLSRYGIQIEGVAGSTERLNSLIGELTENFEGQSEAVAKVGTGPLEQLKNQLNDIQEVIGNELLPYVVSFGEAIKVLTDIHLNPFLKKLIDIAKYLNITHNMLKLFKGGLNLFTDIFGKEGEKPAQGPLSSVMPVFATDSDEYKKDLQKWYDALEKASELWDDFKNPSTEMPAWGGMPEVETFSSLVDRQRALWENLPDWVWDTTEAFDEASDTWLEKLGEINIKLDEFAQNIKIAFVDIIGGAIGNFIDDLFTQIGEGVLTLKSLGDSLLNIFSDVLTQLGQTYLAAGIAMSILKPGTGTRMIAAGAGLIAAGGLIKGVSNKMANSQTSSSYSDWDNRNSVITGSISNNVIKLSNDRALATTTYHGIRY